MRVLLGSNLIEDCEAALVVAGVEVFRFRERSGDGRLVVDFDVRGPKGELIAKVAKNNVVHSAPGYEISHEPRVSKLRKTDSGRVLAMVEELGEDTIRITGTFWVDKFLVVIGESGLSIGGVGVSGTKIRGFRKAIRIDPGSFSIGCS